MSTKCWRNFMNRRDFIKTTAAAALLPSVCAGALTPDPTPAKLTRDEILQNIVECGRILDENNVPAEGRWIVTDLTEEEIHALLPGVEVRPVDRSPDGNWWMGGA